MSITAPTPAGLPPSSAKPHHNRDLTLQKYMLLHEQHESLSQHLDELRPQRCGSFAPISSTATTSPATSPTRLSFYPSLSTQTTPYHSRSSSISGGRHRRSSLPAPPRTNYSLACGSRALETVLDESTLSELATEEAKLSDVNESIKRTLTELLNCDAVREDRAFRTWVQCRLMETEKELRSGRRRRSAPEV